AGVRGAWYDAPMLDIRRIREEPDAIKASLATVGVDPAEIDALLALDAERRAAMAAAVEQVAALEARFEARMLELPNTPHPDVPVGADERDNVVVRHVG